MSDDLISRQAAIDALEKKKDKKSQGDISGFYNKIIQNDIDTLMLLPSADRPQEWIPCSERMPESQGYYICTCKDGSKYKRASAVKWSNGWQLTGARAYWIVLAWMPLPKPWKGADDVG